MKKSFLFLVLILIVSFSLFANTYSGRGDDVIEVSYSGTGDYVFRIKGNASGRYFGVTGYDDYGNYVDLTVNTTDPYSGIVADPHQEISLLEIQSSDSWTIETLPLSSCPSVGSGQTYNGTNDAVIRVTSNGRVAAISGNYSGDYFGVWAVDSRGRQDLLVNEVDPYQGRVMLRGDIAYFIVSATGKWSISL
jgi:predicted small secreted protein